MNMGYFWMINKINAFSKYIFKVAAEPAEQYPPISKPIVSIRPGIPCLARLALCADCHNAPYAQEKSYGFLVRAFCSLRTVPMGMLGLPNYNIRFWKPSERHT